jgi:hypothetical protein
VFLDLVNFDCWRSKGAEQEAWFVYFTFLRGTVPEKKPRAERIFDLLENHLGRPPIDCSDCGAKDSLIRILLPPKVRAPSADFVDVAVK